MRVRANRSRELWHRNVKGRVRLTNSDRWFFVQLYRWFPSILTAFEAICRVRCGRRAPNLRQHSVAGSGGTGWISLSITMVT